MSDWQDAITVIIRTVGIFCTLVVALLALSIYLPGFGGFYYFSILSDSLYFFGVLALCGALYWTTD